MQKCENTNRERLERRTLFLQLRNLFNFEFAVLAGLTSGFLLCYSCTFFIFFLLKINVLCPVSVLQSADCTERKRKGILESGHSFVLTLNICVREKWLVNYILSEKHEPYFPPHLISSFCFFLMFVERLSGQQASSYQTGAYCSGYRQDAVKKLDGRSAHNLSAPGAIWPSLYMCRWCPHPHLGNDSSQGRVTFYPVLTEYVLHP